MRKPVLLVTLCAALCLTSCMDLNLKMNLAANGSAKASLQLEMLDQLYGSLRGMAAAAGYDLSVLDKAGAEQFFTDTKGRLENYSNTVEQGVRTISMSVSTDDGIAWLNRVAPQQLGVEPVADQPDTFQLQLLKGDLSESLTTMDEATLEQYLASLRPMMTGFYAEMEFQFPEVVESNMRKPAPNKVAFILDFDQDLADLNGNEAVSEMKRLLGPKSVTFKGVIRP